MDPQTLQSWLTLLERSGPLALLVYALWRKWLVLGWAYKEKEEQVVRLTGRVDALTALALKGTALAEAYAAEKQRIP